MGCKSRENKLWSRLEMHEIWVSCNKKLISQKYTSSSIKSQIKYSTLHFSIHQFSFKQNLNEQKKPECWDRWLRCCGTGCPCITLKLSDPLSSVFPPLFLSPVVCCWNGCDDHVLLWHQNEKPGAQALVF